MKNNLAIGNYMNHPPKGKLPNVIDLKMKMVESHFPKDLVPTRVSFDFTLDFKY